MSNLEELAAAHDCLETVDRSEFQRKARILQSLWREERGYPIGKFRGRQIDSHLDMPWAEQTMANFLDDDIRQVVRDVLQQDGPGDEKRLIQKDRLFANLLSSQPLAFNLFAHLRLDLSLAKRVMQDLAGERIGNVTAVEFELSPGRGDDRYTGDNSAFDVYVLYDGPEGRGFAGIEVKYHEGLDNPPARHRRRYDQVAADMGCFAPEARERLRTKPLQQFWRDHLLAGAHLMVDGFSDGFFALLSPAGNEACSNAAAAYRGCLTNTRTFEHWTIESFLAACRRHSDAEWIAAVKGRYLDFARLVALIAP